MPPEGSDQETRIPTRPKRNSQARKTRVLACTSCQQRKVRCDRNSPCGNCIKSGQICIAASTVPRKRRFPERALLDRLRRYESLLQENGISFDPLHSTQMAVDGVGLPRTTDGGDTSDEDAEPSSSRSTMTSNSSAREFWHKDMWKAVYGKYGDEYLYDESDSSTTSTEQYRPRRHNPARRPEDVLKQGWNILFSNNDHLILGLRGSAINLAHLHPEPILVLRLWQIYLENVDPLLKVTHSSSLQARIVEAISKLTDPQSIVEPPLEALMFSIYCTAISSLEEGDCRALLAAGRKELLRKYHLACQEALLNAGYLRSGDRDCLTAFLLYLLSAGQDADPRAVCSMLGAAIRLGQRMRLHSEAANAKYPPYEAEMRRRLWWALVLFEARISEMADMKVSSLAPTWDCKIPLNISDSELRPDLQDVPREEKSYATEAIFPVVRAAIADYIRRTTLFLDATCPALKPLVKDRTHLSRPSLSPSSEGSGQTQNQSQGGRGKGVFESELDALERQIEEKYLRRCDTGNPIQYTTIWSARTFIAKYRQIEYFMAHADSPRSQTEFQRATAAAGALRILECDNMIMNAEPKHLTKGFRWLHRFYFPLPSYLYLSQELKRCPIQDLADRAWYLMSINHAARSGRRPIMTTTQNSSSSSSEDGCSNDVRADGDDERWSPVVIFFANALIDAWKAREDAVERMGASPLPVPGVVTELKNALDAVATATATATATVFPTSQNSDSTCGIISEAAMVDATSAAAITTAAPEAAPGTLMNHPSMGDMSTLLLSEPYYNNAPGLAVPPADPEQLGMNPWSPDGGAGLQVNVDNALDFGPFDSLWGTTAWEMGGYGAW